MRCSHIRTWKSRDMQAQRPLSWCKQCGRELYEGVTCDSLCPPCRRRRRRRRP